MGVCLRLGWADWCSPRHYLRLQDRAPPARRIATQGRSHICFGPVSPVPMARAPWVHGWRSIKSDCTPFNTAWNNQGGQRWPYRMDWPETNVGAALRRDAPRGRRSVLQAQKKSRQAPVCPTRSKPISPKPINLPPPHPIPYTRSIPPQDRPHARDPAQPPQPGL